MKSLLFFIKWLNWWYRIRYTWLQTFGLLSLYPCGVIWVMYEDIPVWWFTVATLNYKSQGKKVSQSASWHLVWNFSGLCWLTMVDYQWAGPKSHMTEGQIPESCHQVEMKMVSMTKVWLLWWLRWDFFVLDKAELLGKAKGSKNLSEQSRWESLCSRLVYVRLTSEIMLCLNSLSTWSSSLWMTRDICVDLQALFVCLSFKFGQS